MTLHQGADMRPPTDDLPDPSVRPAHLAQVQFENDQSDGLRLPTLLDLVGVAAMVVGALLPMVLWGRLFADRGHVAPIVIAALVGAGVATAMFALRRTSGTSFAALLVAMVVGLLARYNTDAADLFGDLVDSWKSLASTGLLIPTSREFLIPPMIVTAFASWWAATVVLRQWSGVLVAPPLFGAIAVALAYTVSLGGLPGWFVPALVAVVGLGLVTSAVRRPGGAEFADRSSIPVRQVAIGVGLVALLAAGAGLVSSLVGGVADEAFDLRAELARPLDIYEAATPLASVKSGLIADVPNDVFTIRLDALPAGVEVTLIPVATLDTYDGSVWSTTAQFEPAGARLPSPEQVADVGAGQVQQRVELTAAYPFRFLPRAGVVRNLTGEGLAWDPRSGTVATIDSNTDAYGGLISVAGLRPDSLPAPGRIPGALRYATERPETTEGQAEVLVQYAQAVVTADDPLEERLGKLEADLRSGAFFYNEEAPAGHSLAALTSYLRPEVDPDDPTASVPRIGFAEQSASVFAVLAREMGLASRVVVGYRLEQPLTAEDPERTVDEGQIHAWPEVWFEGLGWVPFDPTNAENRSDDLTARTPAVSSAGQEAAQGQLPEFQEPVLLPPQVETPGRSPLWWLLLIPALGVLYAVAVIGAKALRRTRRRRSVDADRRVVGAWREVRDRLGELGLPASRSASALDLAERLDVIDLRDLAAPIGDLAPVIDDALYAPSPVSAGDADRAWELSATAIKAARKHAGVKQRVTAALDPRTLFS